VPARSSRVESADREVLITRVFDAPRALVYKAWTDPQQLLRWFAPTGCTIDFRHIDVRVGGTFHSCIRTPDGQDCWCTGRYRELRPAERIVYTVAMSDAAGNRASSADAGKDADWPQETVVTVTLADDRGGTRLTLHQTVSETVAKRTGAYPSWLVMLDRLAYELADIQ
jgi:uncharacterized protein YndB with AHSA1/START domain